MSKQRYVQDSFWTDPYIEKLDPSEKLLFLYFLTNPLCNIAGIYEIRNNRIAYETGFDKDMVEKIKQRFIRDKKMICVNDWIILLNFVKNQSNNPSVLAGVQRILNDLPENVSNKLTACIQAGGSLSYFTLLNLTLLNSTQRKINEPVINPNNQVSEVIKLFETINPACSKMYGNKTQRNACQNLLDQHGLEKLGMMIQTLKKTNTMKYAPTITTPLQLEDKMTQLLAFISKEKSNEVIL